MLVKLGWIEMELKNAIMIANAKILKMVSSAILFSIFFDLLLLNLAFCLFIDIILLK